MGQGKERKGKEGLLRERYTQFMSCHPGVVLPLPLCCTAHPQGGAIYTGVLVTVDWK